MTIFLVELQLIGANELLVARGTREQFPCVGILIVELQLVGTKELPVADRT